MRARLFFFLPLLLCGAALLFFPASWPLALADPGPEPSPNADAIYIPGTHFGIKEGLPSPNTNGMAQTPDKLLWVSTEEGLVRYNGVTFQAIQRGDVAGDDFPSNTLNTLWPTGDNKLWLAFSNAGVGLFDPSTLQMRLFGVRGQGPNALMGDDVWHFGQDQQQRIWMLEYGEGFSVWDPRTDRMQHIVAKTTDADSWLPSNQLFDFFIDDNDVLWAVTLDSRVIRHELQSGKTRSFDLRTDAEDPFSNPLYTIRRIHGRVLAGGYDGLFEYNPQTRRFDQLLSRKDMERSPGNSQSLMSLLGDRYGGVWIGTTNGLYYWKDQRLASVSLFEFGQLLPLRDSVMALYRDHEGGTWAMTDSNGIFKLNNNWNQFSYFLPFTEEDRLSGNHIRAVATANQQKFWLAYVKGQRLDEVRLDATGFRLVRQSLDNPNVPSRPISLYYDTHDNLWLGSLDGLYLLHPRANFRSQRLRLPKDLAREPLVGRIRSLQQQGQRLWLTVFDAEHPAYVELEKSPLRIQSYLSVVFDPREGEQRILPAPETEKNRLWLISPTHLRELDTDTNTLRDLLTSQASLQDFFIRPGSNRVWGLIDGQLNAYRWQNGQLHPTPEENPLQSTTASPAPQSDPDDPLIRRAFYTHVLEDKRGNLWLGSNIGLLQVNLGTGKGQFYTEAEGLPSREIIDLQLTDSGQALIVTKWGLVTPNPLYQPVPPGKPPLIVQGVYHGDQPLPLRQPVSLPYDYGLVRLEYALLAFNNPEATQYFYRLNPDQPWMRADGPQLSLMQLPPGHYQVQIKGKTPEGKESDPATVSLTILPPPWLSKSAFVLYAVLALIVLGLAAWLWRRKISRDYALRHAGEKREFAENQLALTRSLVSTLDFNEVLHRVVEQIRQRVRADDVLLLLWDAESQQRAVATSPDLKPTAEELEALQGMHPAMAAGANQVLQVSQDNQHSLIVPFTSASHKFGLLRLRRKKRPFADRHKALLQAYATQASVALENARLFSEVQRLAKEANAASQAKSDFLARVSHEVRTPMNGVLGMTELLLDSDLSEEQKLYAEAIQSSGEHLLGIINDILDLSKIEAGKLQLETADFDLQQVLEDVVQLFAPPACKQRIALYYLLDPALPRCRHGDALRLKQILFNLLSNAIKFTRRGHIIVRAEADPSDPQRVHFSVEDSGIGIRNDNARTLFEPFVQADNATSRKYGGTGLGLAIARQLVEKMDGQIKAQGSPGVGSRFSFSVRLPLCVKPASHATGACPRVRVACLTSSPHVKAQVDNAMALCGLTASATATAADWLLVDASAPLTPEQQRVLQSIDPEKTRVLILAYAREDLQAMGASVPANSRLVLLPLTPRSLRLALTGDEQAGNLTATETAGESQRHAHPITDQAVKVLVVEDNPINHQVATEMLEKAGFVVDVVESGEEALARVRDEDYDIILSDYHLPDLNGIDMAQQLAQRQLQQGREPTPVVLVTADLTDNTWRKAAAAGIRSLLPKPFTQDALVQAIRTVLRPD